MECSYLLRLFFSSENSSQGRSIVIWNQGGAGEVNWTTVKMEKSILVRGCLELEGSWWHGQLWSSGELAFPVCSQAELRLRCGRYHHEADVDYLENIEMSPMEDAVWRAHQ